MGNVSSLARASTGLDSYVAELGNDLSYDRSLSSSRFLKTILARHVKGPLVLKIFIKPDPGMSLRVIQRRLKIERDTLLDLPNIHTSQAFVETDKAGYLIRQWGRFNLYDRISSQPYLATIEKTWVAFQILTALRDARTRKIAHGDIKSENILITSDLSVLITDFSTSFKPTFLPLDDPSDFSFFFDTSGRRTCYLAPERFFPADSHLARARQERDQDADQWGKRDGKVSEAMDVFSVGCVLLEMWTEGRGVFSLSDLFAYRDGALSLDTLLEGLDDGAVKSMIFSMLSLNPDHRPSFDRLLTDYRGTVFPEYFYIFFAEYSLSLNEAIKDDSEPSPDHVIRRLSDEWGSVKVYLTKEVTEGSQRHSAVDETGPALLLLNLVTANCRSCVWPTSRLRSLELLKRLASFLTDEDIINRALPFVLTALSDDMASVRAAACESLVEMIDGITSITPQNALFLPEYVLPALKVLTVDIDVLVRCVYARGLVCLATKAAEILEMAVALQGQGMGSDVESQVTESTYETLLEDISQLVEDHASALLIDPSSQVKRVMLSTVAELCLFFGRRKSNDFILSHIMTYLNDRDWSLRFAFFDAIVGVGAFLGHVSVEEYVLPLMMQALADSEEYVIVRVIGSLTSLASIGLFPRGRLWDLCQTLQPYLVHPNAWIRRGAAGFLAAATTKLPPTDVWCILYPHIREMLQSDVKVLNAPSLLDAVRPPLSRAVFNSAKGWAAQESASAVWNPPVLPRASEGKSTLPKSALRSPKSVSTAYETYFLGKGLPTSEVDNLVVLRDLIIRQADQSKSRPNSDVLGFEENELLAPSLSLIRLGVTPVTVFINPRVVDVDFDSNVRKLGRINSVAGLSSRRSSFASKARSEVSPLEEIRRRLANLEPRSGASLTLDETEGGLSAVMPHQETTKSPSGSLDITPLSAIKRGASDSTKAAPAVGAVHANAQGTLGAPRHGRDAFVVRVQSTTSQPSSASGGPSLYTSTYEGRDPGVRHLLDHVDLQNYQEPMLNFGPRISTSSLRRRSANRSGPSRPTGSSPRAATLIAHLAHHTAGITCFAASPDHTFFVSGSSDGLICVWDTVRLERSVSAKPRLIYRGLDAPITALCTIENSHCLAAASANGQIHILRVHVLIGTGSSKYSRIECLHEWSVPIEDGVVMSMRHGPDLNSLLYVATSGFIEILDLRTWQLRCARMRQPVTQGALTAVCVDKSFQWIIVGTASGHIALWDLRFGLCVKTWRANGPVLSMSIHPSRGRGRWVMVATRAMEMGDNLVEVFDIETAAPVEVYRCQPQRNSGGTSPGAVNDAVAVQKTISASAATVARLAHSQPLQSAPSFSAVLTTLTGESIVGSKTTAHDEESPLFPVQESQKSTTVLGSQGAHAGWMITGGEDRTLRFWDLVNVAEGFVISGSGKDKDAVFSQSTGPSGVAECLAEPRKEAARFSTGPQARITRSVEVDNGARKISNAMHHTRQLLRPHYDAISALIMIETPYSSCVASGDRSGVIKVWRIEGLRS